MTFYKSPGGACAPAGFVSAGVAAGIKGSGALDLALLVSEKPAAVAGVFTKNTAAAAPVVVCRERISSGSARGVVVNSGCANACTGEGGMHDAVEMAQLAAVAAGVEEAGMLVCSTGLIGSRLPMDKVREGIKTAAARLGHDDKDAAAAILTTDTRAKRLAFSHPNGWSIGGMAKGAGMIAPNMATMLSLITTDAVLEPGQLKQALAATVEGTFNAISIDGDTSTNDTVLAFANGASGMTAAPQAFGEGLEMLCAALAQMIVADGEGRTKILKVAVTGARSRPEAQVAARVVAESTLVKTAVYGQDANWGRVVAALGRSGARFQTDRLVVSMAGIELFRQGMGAGKTAVLRAREAMAADEIEICCDLGEGGASARMLSTDLSPEYVKLNAAYEA